MIVKESFRKALAESLVEIGESSKDVVVITPDLAKSVRILEYKRLYPKRFISVGISEADMISVAAGMATIGLVPIVVAFAMFAVEKPYEQIRNSIAYPNLNVKIFATHGGLCVGRDGATHQAIEDLAIMRALPNMSVITAADGLETKAAVKAALEHKGPVYLRLGRDEAEKVYKERKKVIFGQSDILREGTDVTIIACGVMVSNSMKAAEKLSSLGIQARVINSFSIKPMDEKEIIKAAKNTGAIVTVEDHSRIGGLGGAISELIVKTYPVPIEQVAIDDTFGESGSKDELYKKYKLTPDDIVKAAKRVILRKSAKGR